MRGQTALGIEISNDRINLALLGKSADGIVLLKVASGPVPDGAIKNGNVEDPAILAGAVKALKARHKMRAAQAAVSLLAKSVLMQIIDMPERVPGNIGQFVQNQVKQCVALSGKEIALDFCGVAPAGRGGGKRLFVAAADVANVAGLAKACNQFRLNVESVEPPLIAYARALYEKRIAGKFDCNVMMMIVQDDCLALCVFRKQSLDFVRTMDIGVENARPGEISGRLADQINAVIQYYDVEVHDSAEKWEATLVTDSMQLLTDARESLIAKVTRAELHLRTPENAAQDTSIGGDITTGASAVAIGLALKLLGQDQSNLRINLVPPESAEVKSFKKHAVITANVIAALLLLMILAGGVLGLITKKVNGNIERIKQTKSSQDTLALLKEEELADKQIIRLSEALERMNNITASRRDLLWRDLLNDIKKATPKNVRIIDLFSKGNSAMSLKGLATSYEAVHLFVRMLNKSEYIDSASLVETEKSNEYGGLARYVINCSLLQGKGSLADAD